MLHTADWHLGRLFHAVHLTDDQEHMLRQFIQLVDEVKPDVILVSGDIYDRAIPPVEAVQLLNDTLSQIILDFGVPIVMITGNHDNPYRVGFGYRLLARQGLYLYGTLASSADPLEICDQYGPVRFYSVPFCDLHTARDHFAGSDAVIDCADSAMRALLADAEHRNPRNGRSVLLAHAFVAGGEASDSERPLSVGGVDYVGADCFEGFDYVALGHLHQPQRIEGDRIRYPGSLMKYSFNEAAQRKSVSLVEIDASGDLRIEEFVLTPRRDVRRIEGALSDLLQRPDDYGPRDDYIMAVLHDDGALFDPFARLREKFPNLLDLQRPGLLIGDQSHASARDLTGKADLDLFQDFMSAMTGQTMDDAQTSVFIDVAETVRRDGLETGT